MFGRNSRDTARNRLAAVVCADRASFPPGLIDKLKSVVVDAVSEHLDVDEPKADVRLARTGRSVELIASVPVERVRSGRGS